MGIDFLGPAFDAAGQGFCGGDTLVAEPYGYVEAAHAVVAIADYVVVDVEGLQICRDLAHGDQLGAFDATHVEFPWFSDIDEEDFFAAIEALFEFDGGQFEIGHGHWRQRD